MTNNPQFRYLCYKQLGLWFCFHRWNQGYLEFLNFAWGWMITPHIFHNRLNLATQIWCIVQQKAVKGLYVLAIHTSYHMHVTLSHNFWTNECTEREIIACNMLMIIYKIFNISIVNLRGADVHLTSLLAQKGIIRVSITRLSFVFTPSNRCLAETHHSPHIKTQRGLPTRMHTHLWSKE